MPDPFQPRTPGYRFKDGRLMIFREEEVMLIRGWDEPSAICKADDGWEPFAPEFRLVAPYRRAVKKTPTKVADPAPPPAGGQMSFDLFADAPPPAAPAAKPVTPRPTPLAEQRRIAFDSFRFSLPKEVAKVLEPFRSHQWSLLVLLAHDKRSLDLVNANPGLAYAVADWYADYPRSRLDFGRMPQRDLLKLLKLPDSAALVKILRKIPPESVEPQLVKCMMTALRKPESASFKLLTHASSINLGVLELILSPGIRSAVTPNLLEEVAANPREKYRAEAASLIRDIVAMNEELADYRPPGPMKSVACLRIRHGEVSAEFQKLDKLRKAHGLLPKPPLPGIPDRIVPLETPEELLAEGREQSNCVASYTAAVVDRRCYIYRILHPSRATLRIHRQADGNWGIAEIKASCNRESRPETREYVKQWLEPYQIGL